MKSKIFVLISLLFAILCSCNKKSTNLLYKSSKFTFYSNSIVQDSSKAVALSTTQIMSNYISPAKKKYNRTIHFKFSINCKDNERASGKDNMMTLIPVNGESKTPLIKFGTQLVDTASMQSNLEPNTKWTVRLDMRDIFSSFREKGYYTLYNGDKLYKTDFKGVFIAGDAEPLSWDFENLKNKNLELKDPDGDGIYEISLTMNDSINNSEIKKWTIKHNIYQYPQISSGHLMIDALYNLGLDELKTNIEPDSTFRTGKEWAGVWTRDISYSILLSLAIVEPEISKKCLMRKVKNGKIIQDTGTGGAWPVSTDRVVWVLAAYEIYKVTNDQEWLNTIYPIIKNSLDADIETIFDQTTHLVKGESSFLDWRQQTYPNWMSSVDIYSSLNLGTNVVHARAYEIIAEISKLKGINGTKYQRIANDLKKGINQYLWLPDKGYYGQYLYGRLQKSLSPRSEGLGEALSILYNIIPDQQKETIINNIPVTPYGISCIYPQIPTVPPYHNNAIWPFVQAYWNWGAAKVHNYKALEKGLADFYRPAALFLTNKENFVAENGDYFGTQINSDRQLWSVAANLAMVYRVLAGMEFSPEGLTFAPVIPENYGRKLILKNLKFRETLLNIEIDGVGHTINRTLLDGKPINKAFIASSLKGKHILKIKLSNKIENKGKVNLVDNKFSMTTPVVHINGNELIWDKVANASKYIIYCQGIQIIKTSETAVKLNSIKTATEYQVKAVDINGMESFLSEPIYITDLNNNWFVEAEQFIPKSTLPYKGFSGSGFVELTKTENTSISLEFNSPDSGKYIIDFRYSNGSGPYNTENKCAIRSLLINNQYVCSVVFPQIGLDEWSNFGYSNHCEVPFVKGKNIITLKYLPFNENMNIDVNTAMLDGVRIRKL
ncbi:MAG: glycogen debranching protein [Bacteroidetes bacterium]|nr:glycogen debranching protein [Bacteroidota bacterium]